MRKQTCSFAGLRSASDRSLCLGFDTLRGGSLSYGKHISWHGGRARKRLRTLAALPLDVELPNETARGEHVLQRMEAFGRSLKCKVEGDILQARDTGAAVVREAADRQTDVIVAGMPYTERYGSPSLGEMVPYVLRHSPCRVIVYREQQPAPIPEGA